MILMRKAWLPAVGAVIALGCGNGGTTGTGGSSSASSSSAAATTSTSTTTTTTTSTSGTGGAGGGATTSSSGGTGGGIAYVPSGFACSGKTPTLTADVVPITSASCTTGPSCHVALHTANGVIGMFVNRPTEECNDGRLMVKPGAPEASYVIHKITDHNLCANQPSMPQIGAPLTADKIQIIYDWICEGAPNN